MLGSLELEDLPFLDTNSLSLFHRRTWLECYRYWNQGGKENVKSMLDIIGERCRGSNVLSDDLPPVLTTPDTGLIHPVYYRDPNRTSQSPYFLSPSSYLAWRRSRRAKEAARRQHFHLADDDAPVVAVLLFRKHVITEQRYILDLLTSMEEDNIIPVPIFINGVEAHTIVRDYLTSNHEAEQVSVGRSSRPDTYQERQAARVDAIINVSMHPCSRELLRFLLSSTLTSGRSSTDNWIPSGGGSCWLHASGS